MKKIITIPFAIIVVVLVSIVAVYQFVNFNTEDKNMEEIDFGPRSEYEETYLKISYDELDAISSLEGMEENEFDIFKQKMEEQKLNPKSVLQAGNELYFISEIEKDGLKGQGVLLYDVVDRKIYVLFFRSLEELKQDKRFFILAGIDVINSQLILAYVLENDTCASPWLRAGEYVFSFDLYSGAETKIKKYSVPTWKVEEERVKFPNCTP